jgi:hypothetical protein
MSSVYTNIQKAAFKLYAEENPRNAPIYTWDTIGPLIQEYYLQKLAQAFFAKWEAFEVTHAEHTACALACEAFGLDATLAEWVELVEYQG